MSETDDQLARRLLKKVLDFDEPWTPDMRLRIATVSQVYASLAIVEELRRLNERGDRFNEAMLGFFEKLTDPFAAQEEDGSLRSGQPAAAPDGPALQSPPCVICGKEGNRYRVCMKGTELTKAQWEKHAEDEYDEAREHGAGKDTAWARAIEKANERFGPCPEES